MGLLQKSKLIPLKFSQLRWRYRFLILALATAWLFLMSAGFYKKVLAPVITEILSGKTSFFYKINTLQYFDIAVCIALVLFVIAILALIFGRPDHPGRLLFFLKGRPVSTLILFTSVIGVVLSTTPKVVADLLLDMSWPVSPFEDIFCAHPRFIKESIILALCVGLSISDIAMKPGTARFWVLLLLVFPPMIRFPLLWWNCLAWLLPSRYWQFWRPILVLASCAVPLLIFPLAQPIRSDITGEDQKLVVYGPEKQRLGCDRGYDIHQVPGWGELYINCNNQLSRYSRDDSGQWVVKAGLTLAFSWKHFALDLINNHLYVVNVQSMSVDSFRLPDFAFEKSIPLPESFFRNDAWHFYVAHHNGRQLLAIGNEHGEVIICDTDRAEVIVKRMMPFDIPEIWGLDFDSRGEHLFVLGNRDLMRLNAGDLTTAGSVKFSTGAYGQFYDYKTNRLMVALPEKSSVLMMNADSLEIEKAVDAPMGVRLITKDDAGNRYFFASMTGAVEMRDGEDFHLLHRIRLSPWLQSIEALPEYGELIATTSKSDTVVWQYEPAQTKFNFFDQVLFLVERVYSGFISSVKIVEPSG